MSAALKKKGPEALERLPSRVQSHPRKVREMNNATHSTVAVAHPAETPYNELSGAVAALHLISELLFASPAGMDKDDVYRASLVLSDALLRIEPVSAYLDEIEHAEGHQAIFLECRREWTRKAAGGCEA